MAINYESLMEFARRNGNITLYAPEGKITILKDGTADVFDTIEKAMTFIFDGKRYTRTEFDKLLSAPNSK